MDKLTKQEKTKFFKQLYAEQMERLSKCTHPNDLHKKEKNYKKFVKDNYIENYISEIEDDILSILNQ